MLMPFTSINAQFHPGDSLVIQAIRTTNFTVNTALNWNDPNPGNWLGVVWNTAIPKRIIQLGLDEDGSVSGKAFHSGLAVGSVPAEYVGQIGAGVNAELTGALDLSGLSALKFLDLKNQGLIDSLNVTGLNNLEHIIMNRNDSLSVLDFSNLANLQVVHISYTGDITSVNASNCPRLKSLKLKSDALNSINLLGSDSLVVLMMPNNGGTIPLLDLTGKVDLEVLIIKSSDVQSIVGMNTLSSLVVFKAGNNSNLVETYNISDYDEANMLKFSVSNTKADSVNNWTALVGNTSLETIGVHDAELTLSNAIQIANEVIANNKADADDQIRYGGDTIYTGGTTNYPGDALIDINGTNVASTFTLYDFNGAQVGASNATGVFTFPAITDTGEYYVEMTNPGAAPANNSVLLTTNNFWVRCTGATNTQTLSICAGDSVLVGTSVYKTTGMFVDALLMATGCDSIVTTDLTVAAPIDLSVTTSNVTITSNEVGATYQWIDCNNANTSIAGETGASYTTTANGSYAVVVTVGSCSDTSACTTISTVGINEFDAGSVVSVYPNPMNNVVTIELERTVKNTQITIVNVEGKTVYSNIVNTAKLSVDGSDWNNGIYIVKITNDEYTKTLKLIK